MRSTSPPTLKLLAQEMRLNSDLGSAKYQLEKKTPITEPEYRQEAVVARHCEPSLLTPVGVASETNSLIDPFRCIVQLAINIFKTRCAGV